MEDRTRFPLNHGFLQRMLPALASVLLASVATAGEVPYSSLSVISDSATQVTTVLSVDLDGDGDFDAVSTKNHTDLVWYENVSGDGSTWTERAVASGYSDFRLASADLDGDGDTDLLSAVASTVTWHDNLAGDGSAWASATVGTTGGGFVTLATADMDGDGDMDALAVGEFSGSDVAWYENTAGDATAWTEHLIVSGGNYGLFAADLDGDGDTDVAWSNASGRLAWQENLAGDGLSWAEHEVGTQPSHLLALHVADLDGDGDLDILGAQDQDDEVSWWENTAGDGTTWTIRTISDSIDGASSVKPGDVDQDGDLDVITTAMNANEIVWHENTAGDGTAWTGHTLATEAAFAFDTAVGDVDGDGDPDLFSILYSGAKIGWFINETIHRSATFPQPATIATTVDHPSGVYAGDLDGDGDIDAVTASGGGASQDELVAWHENTAGDGTAWTEHTISTTVYAPSAVVAADVDGDGDDDVLSASRVSSNTVNWHENMVGDGSAWSQGIISTGVISGVDDMSVGDVDGDGDLDVLSASYHSDLVSWHENAAGDGSTWIWHTIVTGLDGATPVHGGDVDGDGDFDVVSAALVYNRIYWYENTAGDGSAWSEHEIRFAYSTRSLFVEDMDRDGDVDVVAAGVFFQDDWIAWYENTAGDGSAWTVHSLPGPVDHPGGVFVEDLDLDGDPDVLATSEGESRIIWFENTAGDASTWEQRDVVTGLTGRALHAADLDGDGDPDVLSVSNPSDSVEWFRNRGGQFALVSTDTAPATLGEGQTDDVLRITVGHNGRAGDTDVEIASFELMFEKSAGDPLTTAEANGMIDTLRVHIDDGSGQFEESSDVAVATLDTLSLVDGRQTVVLTDDDPQCRVTLAAGSTFFVVLELRLDAGEQPVRTFRVTHVTESSSSADDFEHDIPLTLEFVADTSSSVVGVPLVIPVAAGEVSDGDPWTETHLTLRRSGSSDLILEFGPSCLADDADYAVYEGPLGGFADHVPATCTTGGALTATITPEAGDRYYLVAPQSANREGSHGSDGDGAERAQGPAPCRAQVRGECPPVVPENDLCPGAVAVELDTSIVGTTVEATGPDAAPFSGCSISAPGVWYSVIGTGNTLVASTCGTANYDTKISVFCNGCDEQQMFAVACNDDVVGCFGFTSEISWCSEPDVGYLILVHGFLQQTGSFILSLTDTGTACTPDVNCSGTSFGPH